MNTNPFSVKLTRMKFPEDIAGSIAISGHTLEADKDGWTEVPAHLIQACEDHGLRTEQSFKDEAAAIQYHANQSAKKAKQAAANAAAGR